jgi:phosphotriesterase-related protein
VRGPIDASKLGFTLPHEHVFAGSAGVLETWPELVGGRSAFRDRAVDRLKALKGDGVDTIVDVTPADVGRDIRFLEEVSRRSGMQIVACTGHWLYPSLSMAARTVEELTALFVREIERGIDGTDIKAGVIKVATDREGVTPFLDKALRAAARASKATGVPVTTHTLASAKVGEKQVEIFDAEGLTPASVCIGHSDDTDDMTYLGGLARRGYTIGMDHMPQGLRPAAAGLLSWQQRAETVKKLIDAGFAERVFLSNDWFFALTIAPTGGMDAMEKFNPDGMSFVTRKTIPHLKQLGVTETQIRTMTIDNPRRFFGGVRVFTPGR